MRVEPVTRGVRRSDVVLAGAFLAFSLVQVFWIQPIQSLWFPDQEWFGPLFAVVSVMPLAWRRARPVVAVVVGSSMWWIPSDAFLFLGYVCVVLLLFSVGRWSTSIRRGLLGAGWAVVSGTVGFFGIEQSQDQLVPLLLDAELQDWLSEVRLPGAEAMLGILGFWLLAWGSYAAGRFLAARDRAEEQRIATVREAARREAVEGERARIVRELHDIVGHEVTLMSIQSEAAAQALDIAPDRASEPIAAVRETAHRANRELRAMLDLLGEGELAVVPDGRGLTELVDRAARMGIANRLHVVGDPWPDAPQHWLAVNRIVQEGLTNAGKHSPGQEVDITVDWTPEEVAVRVRNPAAALDGQEVGRGLAGMAERARLLGGDFRADHVDGSFEVTARLPAPQRGPR